MIKIRRKQFNENSVLRLPVVTNQGLTIKESISIMLEMDNTDKTLEMCDNLKEAYNILQVNKRLPQMEGKTPNVKKAMLQALCNKDWNLEKQCFYKDMVSDLKAYKVKGSFLDMISFFVDSEKNTINVYHQSQLILPNGLTITSTQVSLLGVLELQDTIFLDTNDFQLFFEKLSDKKACKRISKELENIDIDNNNIPNLKKYQSDIIDNLKREMREQVTKLAINSELYNKMDSIGLLLD